MSTTETLAPLKFNNLKCVSLIGAAVVWMNGRTPHKGAACCVAHRDGGYVEFSAFGGEVEPAKKKDLGNVAQRRALSFADSQNSFLVRAAGAVTGKHFVWSVYGYTSDLDEILAIGLAFGMGDLGKQQAGKLAADNLHRHLLDEFLDHIANAGGPR